MSEDCHDSNNRPEHTDEREQLLADGITRRVHAYRAIIEARHREFDVLDSEPMAATEPDFLGRISEADSIIAHSLGVTLEN